MPFDRPTLSELVDRIRSDFRSRLGIMGQLLRRAMANVFAMTWAGAVHMLYGYLEWASRQLFPATAEREYLLQDAAFYGFTPLPATFATGSATATGVDGSIIPINTILVRDDGFTYKTTAGATITGGSAIVSLIAVLAGIDGNVVSDGASETLVLETPIANVNSTLFIDAPGLAGGNDEESTEDFRQRFQEYLQEPPAGGSDQDYVAWAKEVAGVTRAWVYRHEDGLGTVVVRFVRDGDPSIFPDVNEVAEVQAHLDEERPVTAEVTAAAPIALTVDFTIELTPDTAETRAAVQAELLDMFQREAEPGDGAGRGTIYLSQMQVAIGVAEGVEDFTLTVPAADVVPDTGELAILGAFTWV